MKKLLVSLGVLASLAVPAAADESLSYEGKVSSGGVDRVGMLAFEINTDDGSIATAYSAETALTAQAVESVALAPAWLRADLRDSYSRVSPETQDIMAGLLLALDDPRLIDEVAFTFARMSPEILEHSSDFLDAAVENARWIYLVDADLDYVEVLDVGDPAADDDFHTTTRYRVMDGAAEVSYTLPRDMYYWYVVHPILDCSEWFDRINPRTGFEATAGEWWRKFYYEDDAEGDYVRPRVLVQPNAVDDAYIAAADFSGPAAYSFFTGPVRSMSSVVRQAGTRMPAFIAFVHGDGRCCDASYPNPDGHVFATTIPAEAAALNGRPGLLENMLRAGQANRELALYVLLSENLGDTVPRKILILRDRNPFDAASDPNETELASLGWDYDVLPSAGLGALVLTTPEAPFVPSDYVKIVVPSDQPLDLYRALSENAVKIEQFVDMGGVFELHGAVRPADDWTALPMPFGLAALPMDGTHAADDLETAGFPLLKEVIEDTPLLWDRQKVILPGERAFDPGEGAIAKIGWWTANNLPWRVTEMATWRRGLSMERSPDPARIIYNHYGNCGEIQDVYGAAMRTLLIPCALGGSLADDHAWNEFYENDEWHPLQVDWSGSVTQIDNWGVAYDADTAGSGKTISGMYMMRPDCALRNVLGRYEPELSSDGLILSGDYSFHVTLRISVIDRNRAPVDGARIAIFTFGLYDPSALYLATWAFTDKDGVAEFTVGENNYYYCQVESPLGVLPDAEHVDLLARDTETAEPGAVIERTYDFSGLNPSTALPFPPVPRISASEAPYAPPGNDVEAWNVAASVSVGRELAYGHSILDEKSWMEPVGAGAVGVYLLDEANYGLLTAGMVAGAIRVSEGVDSDSFEQVLPSGSGKWYLVIAGPERVVGAREVSALVETTRRWPAEEQPEAAGDEQADGAAEDDIGSDGDGGEPGEEGGGEGCGCSVAS